MIFSSSKWFGDQDLGLQLPQIRITQFKSTETRDEVSGKGVTKRFTTQASKTRAQPSRQHSTYSLRIFSLKVMALLVDDQDRHRRPKSPFVSKCTNREQLRCLSHAVLFGTSSHSVLLNAAGL